MTKSEAPRGPGADVWLEAANELGEGPLSHPERRSLLWFDILQKRLFERAWTGGAMRTHALDVMASAAALVDERRVLLATEVDLRLFDLDSGDHMTVIPFLAGDARLRSNDARVHPSGAFWIGSMGKGAERDAGGIWWFRAGELRRLFDRIAIPNGICFSPDGTTAYFADSDQRTIWRVEVDASTGLPAGERTTFRVYGSDEGAPDGAVVDLDGHVWSAAWGAGALHVWTPEGIRAARIGLPVSQPTCPAVIGAACNTMVVTSAREHMSPEALAREPLAGCVLKLGLTVRGLREPRVRMAP